MDHRQQLAICTLLKQLGDKVDAINVRLNEVIQMLEEDEYETEEETDEEEEEDEDMDEEEAVDLLLMIANNLNPPVD